MLVTCTAVTTHTDTYVNTSTIYVDFGRICTEFRVLSPSAESKTPMLSPSTCPSYISVIAVVGSRMCTTSAVCCSRGVQPGSRLCRTSLQIPVKETIFPSQRCLVCVNSSGDVYLTPTHSPAYSLASSEASCDVSKLHLSG